MNLILGTANFCRDYGKSLNRDECFEILKRAEELGIKTVATAFDYGKDVIDDYGWKDIIHKYEPGKIRWGQLEGVTLDEFKIHTGLMMAPLNPLNRDFLYTASEDWFIARSIFCGGSLQRSHPEDIARLCFGFLKSHKVKNAVVGVESVFELELIVRVANEK